MSEASPRPWKVIENNWQYTTIYDANGREVCNLDLERFDELDEDNQDEHEGVQKVDAGLIVDAVNSVDALHKEVARLRGALERIAKYGDNGLCPYGCDTPHIAQATLTQGKGGANG